VLVACCAIVLWSARVWWRYRDLDNAAVDRAVQAFESPDAVERLSAVRELGRFGLKAHEAALPPLFAALKDADGDVRAAAAEAIGNVLADAGGAGAAAPSLVRCLQDKEPVVRAAAARALGSIAAKKRAAGKTPIEAAAVLGTLVKLLSDQHARVRSAALAALADVGPGAAVAPPPELIAALQDPSADNRAEAAAAIASFDRGLDPVIPLLLRAIEDAGPRVRPRYILALNTIKPPAISEAIIPDLTAALASHDGRTRSLAVSLLVRIAPQSGAAIGVLIKTLGEPIEPHRDVTDFEDPVILAAMGLGKLAPATHWADESIAALAHLARRGDARRRSAAAGALGNFGQQAATAVPALTQRLRETMSAPVSLGDGASSAAALGQIAPGTTFADESVVALSAALAASSDYTRAAAVKALMRFGPKSAQALPQIRAMQEDSSPLVRAAVATALAPVPDRDSEKPIQTSPSAATRASP
jgi:HEAT repeat protein